MSDQAPDRHRHLLGVALGAVVADRIGAPAPPVDLAPFGATLRVDDEGWVLLDTRERTPETLLGGVLAWAVRARVRSVQICAAEHSGTLARRAGEWSLPTSTWVLTGRDLQPMAPTPLPDPDVPPPSHLEFGATIAAAGAEVRVEHAVVTGEVHGLEVCRVVDGPAGAPRLEVGVGANDRLTFSMLYEGEPVEASLARVVEMVRNHRSPGAPRHPLNQLARERMLRWHLMQNPGVLGARQISAAPDPLPRPGLALATPCAAQGIDAHGRAMLVVCSVGIDLDVAPYAADARRAQAGIGSPAQPARLVVAVPTRDRVGLQADLLALLRPLPQWSAPELVAVDWES